MDLQEQRAHDNRKKNWSRMLANERARYQRDPVKKAASCKAYRERNREKYRAYLKEYYSRNREKVLASQKERRARLGPVLKERQRWYSAKFKYGVTKKWFDEKVKEQNGLCAICFHPPEKSFHIDHDHTTGEARGLLCLRCNAAIERLDSVPNWAMNAESYRSRPR